MIRFVMMLVVFMPSCLTAQVYSQNPLFAPAPASPVIVGPGSGEIFLTDLNRDGHLDLLTKHLLEENMAVQLGDGKGHFAPAAGSPMQFGYEPGTIALGDINNDTILDLGVMSKDDDSEKIAVFLGNGTGGFSLTAGTAFTTSVSMAYYKPSLRFVDINKDGKLDIITANGRRNSIEPLFGDGQGGFSSGPVVSLKPDQDFYSFAPGDVDEDGQLDLVIVNSPRPTVEPGEVVVKRGDGKGGFKDLVGSASPVSGRPRLETLADVNGDHHLDLVLSHDDSDLLTILLNKGNGLFTPAPGSPLKLGTPVFAVVVADANQDQQADILAATVDASASASGSRIVVLLGDGKGFAPAPGSPFPAGPGAYNLTTGDVNEDGKLDIAASSFEGDAVTVLLGQ